MSQKVMKLFWHLRCCFFSSCVAKHARFFNDFIFFLCAKSSKRSKNLNLLSVLNSIESNQREFAYIVDPISLWNTRINFLCLLPFLGSFEFREAPKMIWKKKTFCGFFKINFAIELKRTGVKQIRLTGNSSYKLLR